eukprot:g44967.t1
MMVKDRYRIMTQCWQHRPEYRPDFSTILERINYCTQDPDIVNTLLPVEYGPTAEDEGNTVMRPDSSGGVTPLLRVSSTLAATRPHTASQMAEFLQSGSKLQNIQELPKGESFGTKVENGYQTAPTSGHWLYYEAGAAHSSEVKPQQEQRLRNQTKTLWNPTYGSWVSESYQRASVPSEVGEKPLNAAEREDSGLDCNSSSPPSSRESPSPGSHGLALEVGGQLLLKAQSFPCGNINYAYDGLGIDTDGAQ